MLFLFLPSNHRLVLTSEVATGFCGTVFVVLNRIVLSIIWFGVQSWQGGLMTYVCLRAIWPSIDNIPNTIPASTGMTLPQFVGFIVYFVIQLPFLLLDPKRVRYLLYSAAIGGFFVQLVLVSWACGTRGKDGFGDVLSSGTRLSGKTLGWMFVYGVTVTMSTITSGTASVCDYTRFARRPSSATWSQGMGALPAWLSNIFGVLTIAATQKRYGSELWSVASLLIAIQTADSSSATRVAVFFCGLFFGISQLALNIAGNSFSGGTDMATLLPRYINIRRGQYITAILGLVINPWYLLSGAVVFISVMSAYTVFIQPFLGILVAQYFIVQRRRLKVADLYVTGQKSIYWYTCGVNWRAVVAVSVHNLDSGLEQLVLMIVQVVFWHRSSCGRFGEYRQSIHLCVHRRVSNVLSLRSNRILHPSVVFLARHIHGANF